MLAATILVVLLIVLNGVFAMAELALVSARRSRLEAAALAGHRGAGAALRLQSHPNRFLSTVQIGITLVGVVSGAFGEATLAGDIGAWIARSPALRPYAGPLATTIVVVGITYLSLVIGELVPKRLAMADPEKVASGLALPMGLLARLAAPVVWFLSASTDLLLAPFRAAVSPRPDVTEADVKGMIDQATESGSVQERERQIVGQVFHLGDMRVRGLMVPRPEIEYLEESDPPERLRVAVAVSVHSHFPVCRGGLDNVVGVVHIKDLVRAGLISDSVDVPSVAQPPLFVPETTPALRLLDMFRERSTRIALVVDEYGALEGLVTLNDIVEFVLGRVTGAPAADPAEVQRPDGSWLLDGSLPVSRLAAILAVDQLPGHADLDFDTLAGFVLAQLGHIPAIAESFESAGHRFEIVDMDGQRIDRVLVSRLPPPGDSARAHDPAPHRS